MNEQLPRRRLAFEPTVHGAIAASLRGQLVEQGLWAKVLETLDRRVEGETDWATAIAWTRPLALDRYVELLEAVSEVSGNEHLFELGRKRLRGEIDGGLFSTILRSFLRSCAARPDQLLRIGPYLYRAAVRHAGKMELAGAGEGFLRYRILQAPEPLRVSQAWRRFVEGMGMGVFDLGHLVGEVQVAPALDDPNALDVLYLWEAPR